MNPNIKWKVDYDDSNSIYNWVTQMDLYCEEKWRIGLLGSMYFVGFVLSGFILLLADVYGRKIMSIIGNLLSLICVYGLFFCTDIEYAYLWLLLTGLTIFRTYSFYML